MILYNLPLNADSIRVPHQAWRRLGYWTNDSFSVLAFGLTKPGSSWHATYPSAVVQKALPSLLVFAHAIHLQWMEYFPWWFPPITRFLLLANPAYVRPWFQLQKSVASSRKSWLRGSRFSQSAACPLSETTPGLWTRLATVLPHTARCEREDWFIPFIDPCPTPPRIPCLFV